MVTRVGFCVRRFIGSRATVLPFPGLRGPINLIIAFISRLHDVFDSICRRLRSESVTTADPPKPFYWCVAIEAPSG